ncbi:hypothetical protein GO286_05169 [Ralstonia solanacearum]|nr:hypothetical protein [Ralstonia solanacearum]NKF92869.1 hypothetical protein [Ralstonia solanacearum]
MDACSTTLRCASSAAVPPALRVLPVMVMSPLAARPLASVAPLPVARRRMSPDAVSWLALCVSDSLDVRLLLPRALNPIASCGVSSAPAPTSLSELRTRLTLLGSRCASRWLRKVSSGVPTSPTEMPLLCASWDELDHA